MNCEDSIRETREKIAMKLVSFLNMELITQVTEVPLEKVEQFRQAYEELCKLVEVKDNWKEWVAEADVKSRLEWAQDQGRRKVVENLLNGGYSLQKISELLDTPLDDLDKLLNSQ